MTYQGLRDSDVEGKFLSDVLVEDVFSSLLRSYRAALAGERTQVERASEAGDRWFRITSTPLHDDARDVWAGLTMAQDITDLRERTATSAPITNGLRGSCWPMATPSTSSRWRRSFLHSR